MRATAIAHPNVALIKYWGKRSVQGNLPAVGSLSLTLANLETRTTVSFDPNLKRDQVLINGKADGVASARVTTCLNVLRERAGCQHYAAVDSANNFPTAAGLASSASGYAALVTAASGALGLAHDAAALAEVARLGSGSAARSLFPGIVALHVEGDGAAGRVRCESVSLPAEWPLVVVVAITSVATKTIGSTEGMERSRETSPYYQAWLDTHPADLEAALQCVTGQDFARLAQLSEHSCLKMHAVAMGSQPPLVYWSGITLDVLQRIRELRDAGIAVFFTVDAGPQVKAVCLPEAVGRVQQELLAVPGVRETIIAPLGAGAWLE